MDLKVAQVQYHRQSDSLSWRPQLKTFTSSLVRPLVEMRHRDGPAGAPRSKGQPSGDGIGGTLNLRQKRDEWKRIGGGFEGDLYVYNDTVIKTFVTSRSPLRNCINHFSASTEIPAMLLLGGRGDHVARTAQFMPVKDYFLKPSADTEPASWHLLMPFLRGGNLKKLAQRLRSAGSAYRDLDDRFRPSFNRVLAALETMRSGHGLCHDDIKPENIFVDSVSAGGAPSDTRWLLADFGNVREPPHPYHSTWIWTRHSNQNADCRVNDTVRLVKTYVTFLRLVGGQGSDTRCAGREGASGEVHQASAAPRGRGGRGGGGERSAGPGVPAPSLVVSRSAHAKRAEARVVRCRDESQTIRGDVDFWVAIWRLLRRQKSLRFRIVHLSRNGYWKAFFGPRGRLQSRSYPGGARREH
ncbi:hypothetical protein DL765_011511 [Monosporascus sp. GIB2]|nr:hypothetical protein DL765_011511 [Monosporascus sp. GIB2]